MDRRRRTRSAGRVAIITGANSGLGYDTAAVLAAKGAHVVLAVRNLDKGNEAVDRIKKSSPNRLSSLQELDLTSLDSVRQAAGALRTNYPRTLDSHEVVDSRTVQREMAEWLVPNCQSRPSLTSRSHYHHAGIVRSRRSSANAPPLDGRCPATSGRAPATRQPFGLDFLMRSTASLPLSRLRTASTTWAPLAARRPRCRIPTRNWHR